MVYMCVHSIKLEHGCRCDMLVILLSSASGMTVMLHLSGSNVCGCTYNNDYNNNNKYIQIRMYIYMSLWADQRSWGLYRPNGLIRGAFGL